MKKAIVLAVLATLSTGAYASDKNVSVSAGVGKLNVGAKDTSPTARVAVGNDRYAMDYTYFGKVDDVSSSASTCNGGMDSGSYSTAIAAQCSLNGAAGRATTAVESTVHGVGFTGYFTAETNTNIKPFFGVRVGVNHIDYQKASTDYKVTTNTVTDTTTSTATDVSSVLTVVGGDDDKGFHAGAGLVSGARYQLSDTLDVHASAEYHYLGKVAGEKVTQAAANVGVRFKF